MAAAWIYPTLTPTNDLVEDGQADHWIAIGGDPQFKLNDPSGTLSIPAGWVEFDIGLEFLESARRPRLYWDDGEGMSEQKSILLPLPQNGRIRKFLYFHNTITGLRLDPSECESRFRIHGLRIKPTTRYAAARRAITPYLTRAFRNPKMYARFVRDLAKLWFIKGMPAIRAAFSELVSTQSGAAMYSNVAAQLALARHSAFVARTGTTASLGAAALKLRRSEKKRLRIGIGLVEHFGDIVACEPVARYLRKQYPDAEISWVVRDTFRELIDHNPNVDRTIAVDCLTDWIKWRSHGAFDKIVDLHVNERICQHCRIPLHKTDGDPSITGDNHLTYGGLLKAFSLSAGLPPLDDAPRVYIPEAVARTVDAFALPSRYVVFHCRSNAVEKDWDYEKWTTLAQRVASELNVQVVELGLQPTIRHDTPGAINYCGKTDLLQMAEVIRRGAGFVGVDSGPAHFANAASTPSVVLLGQLAQFKSYNPFSGDFGAEKNLTIVRNGHGPAASITVDDVFQALKARIEYAAQVPYTSSSENVRVTSAEAAKTDSDVDPRLIAFYLPQYHPIPENDRAWGKGFTEWRNVGKSRAYFDGQYQPRLPGELGYYDLRLPEIMEQQAALAKEHGIHGFCYYYYWFNGKRLLNLPLDNMLALKRPDFPFCFCWANENWTRRWDGMEREIIVGQNHTPEDDIAFIRFIMPALEDPRYIRVDGKPLLLIYRSELFPDPAASIERWRNEARSAGIGDLFLVRCEGFDPYTNPESIGFDASYEVPTFILPDELKFEDRESLNVSPEFTGRIYDYKKIVDWYCHRPEAEYRRYRGPMLAWDNTPRHGKNALVFHGATPELYGQWIEDSLAHARRRFRGEERLVFVNAWNEWAEGSYLEPDLKFGHGFLEATRAAVARAGCFG